MMKQARIFQVNVFDIIVFVVLAVATAACGSSDLDGDGDGNVDGDSSLCGKNQHLEGGVCTCDTGFVPGDDGCVPMADGDKDGDSKDSDKDGDDSGSDGDEGDGDIDEADGDSTDNADDDNDQSQLCTCPVIDDEFCIDPEVPGALYKRLLVSPGSKPGCSMHVVVYDDYHAAFSGGLSCNEEGRAPIPAIGCVFTYDPIDEEVSIICGTEIFNFRHEWCKAPDGDDTPIDGDEEEPVDGDDDDVQVDGDVDTAENDTDQDDNTIDGDDDLPVDGDVNTCNDHLDCPSTHYCLVALHICVPDVCDNDMGIYCPPFYMCDQWGMCIPDGTGGDSDSDTDTDTTPDGDIDFGCTENEQCQEHYRCLAGSCVLGCTSSFECPPGTFCDYHGNCLELGGDEDAPELDFEEGCNCAVTNEATGEDTCGQGYYCNSACQCVFDCREDNQCQINLGCYCTDKGRCECPEPECDSDYACPDGHFCNLLNLCQAGCPSVPCPSGMYCADNHGHCDAETPDGDTDQDLAIGCNSDNECPVGLHCGASMTCTYVCQFNSQCDSGFECDLHGRCVPDEVQCDTHVECGQGYYCGSDKACHQDCSNDDWCHTHYNPTYSCNDHGYCEILPVDGDEDLPPFMCYKDEDCSPYPYHYCNLAQNTCVAGCDNSNQCDSGYICNFYGKCEQIPDYDADQNPGGWCDNDDDCPNVVGAYPSAQYCAPDHSCQFDCFFGAPDDGCGTGKQCDENGRCQFCGGDVDCGQQTFYCDEVGGCPVGLHCLTDEDICVTECPCPSHLVCDDFGRCVIPQEDADSDPIDGDEDEEKPGVLCANMGDCPLGSYCDLTMDIPECAVDCFRDIDCNNGYYCNCRGQCHPDSNFNDCFPAQTCTAQWQCPYSVPCESVYGGQYCYVHCLNPNLGCDENQECDNLTGHCIDVQIDGDTDTDLDAEAETVDSDPDEVVFGCFDDGDCPNGMYCGIDGICTSDCTPSRSVGACSPVSPDCDGAQLCSDRGRCYVPTVSCSTDNDCPKGSNCMNMIGNSMCIIGCSKNSDCMSGKVCDVSHGRCVDDGSQNPSPVYPSCFSDCDCPVYSHCEGGSCVSQCLMDQGCAYSVEFCSFLGVCEQYVDGDVVVDGDSGSGDGCRPDIPCSSNDYCPYHSYCDLSLGECRAFCGSDYHCDAGKVCNDKGQCVNPPFVWNGSGHDLMSNCEGDDSNCPSGTYCWTEGNVCRFDCVCGENGEPDLLACSGAYTCDYSKGRCVSKRGDD